MLSKMNLALLDPRLAARVQQLRRAADENLPVAELAKSSDVRSVTPEVLATSATAGKNSSAARLKAAASQMHNVTEVAVQDW